MYTIHILKGDVYGMEYCINCGAEIPKGAKFCMECGQKIPVKKSVSTSKPANNAPAIEFDDVDDSFGYVEENLTSEELKSVSHKESERKLSTSPGETENNNDVSEIEKDEPIPEYTSDEAIEEDLTEETNYNESSNNNELDVSKLSTYNNNTSATTRAESTGQEQQPVYVTSPDTDPYWDDVLPEIDNEIYQIPKDIILKGVGVVVGLFLIMAWLIYWIPQI